ncbi:MAG: hypothetical protein K6E30_01670, partial [Lachnospiraceae bacterium]|nr:hypothetical protein [Lachnospiraceae bacterium]
ERYVTIMVPKSMNKILSTKAYFYRQDENVQGEKEKLLVVNCPSFYTLTDFAGSLGRLLHELAHNLRFEDRERRNDVIIRYSAGLLINQLVVDLVERIRTEVETLRDTVTIQRLLENNFKDEFIKFIKKDIPYYGDMKLLNLTERIKKCYLKMVDAVYYLGTLKRYINKFARSSDCFILSSEEVETLWDFHDRFFGGTSDSWEEIGGDEEDKAECLAKEQVEARNKLINLFGGLLFEEGRPREENRDKKDAYGLYHVLCSGTPDDYEDDEEFYIVCMRTAAFIRKLTKSVSNTITEYQHTPDGRKIARYLSMGYYFVSNDSSIDFMELAQNSLLRTRVDSLTIWDENIYMYREIASDLFMVKMLGLTPFGYLNFCTAYIPADGMLNRQFVSRMAMTIYAMNGSDGSEERGNQYLRWQEIFPAMCRYIESVIREILNESEDKNRTLEIRDRFVDFAERMNHYANLPVKTGDNMQKLADQWSQNLKWFSKQKMEESVKYKLMHCVFLCRNFMQIADFYGTEVGEIEWASELSADLVRGGRILDDLHEELRKSSLWQYCSLIQAAFNEPQSANNKVSGVLPAEDIVNFVLDMHYDMLFSSIDKFIDRQSLRSVLD